MLEGKTLRRPVICNGMRFRPLMWSIRHNFSEQNICQTRPSDAIQPWTFIRSHCLEQLRHGSDEGRWAIERTEEVIFFTDPVDTSVGD